MKKHISTIFITISIAICLAISYFCIKTTPKEFASEIFLSKTDIKVEIYTDFYITDYVTITTDNDNYNQNFFYSTESENIKLNYFTGLAKCNEVGSFTVTIKALANEEQLISTNLTINAKRTVYPTSMIMEKQSVVVPIDDFATNKIIYSSPEVNIIPSITYSSSNIVLFDPETCKITPLKEGSCTVYVNFRNSTINLSASFIVEVTSSNYIINNITATINQPKQIEYDINALENTTVTYTNNELVDILEAENSYIIFKPVYEGLFTITVRNGTTIIIYKITITQ